jgi:hypothetical protein
VAAQAGRRARAGFDPVSNDEIAHMLELAFHRLGMPLFDGKPATLVVTVRTPSRRMARATDQRLAGSSNSMAVQPYRIVP